MLQISIQQCGHSPEIINLESNNKCICTSLSIQIYSSRCTQPCHLAATKMSDRKVNIKLFCCQIYTKLFSGFYRRFGSSRICNRWISRGCSVHTSNVLTIPPKDLDILFKNLRKAFLCRSIPLMPNGLNNVPSYLQCVVTYTVQMSRNCNTPGPAHYKKHSPWLYT